MKQKPIEIDFPIEQVNEISEREAHAKQFRVWRIKFGDYINNLSPYSILQTLYYPNLQFHFSAVISISILSPFLRSLKSTIIKLSRTKISIPSGDFDLTTAFWICSCNKNPAG